MTDSELISGLACAAAAFNLTVGWMVGYFVASLLKRGVIEGMLLGLVMGPFGWLTIGFLERRYKRHCPECGGGLPDEPYKRCQHCGQLVGKPSTEPPPLEHVPLGNGR